MMIWCLVVNEHKFVLVANPELLASPVLRFSFDIVAGVHAGAPKCTIGVIYYEGICYTEHVKCRSLGETGFAAWGTLHRVRNAGLTQGEGDVIVTRERRAPWCDTTGVCH